MTKAGARILEAAREAAAIARGDKKPARMHVPADVDVRAIRHKLGLSQDDFASEFGFSVNQIRDWEQRRSRPIGGVRAYLMIIECSPDVVRRTLADMREQARIAETANAKDAARKVTKIRTATVHKVAC